MAGGAVLFSVWERGGTMFAQGDLVVYGGEGVCRVEGVGTPATTGIDKTKMYYTLAPLYRTGQVMTPVDTTWHSRQKSPA